MKIRLYQIIPEFDTDYLSARSLSYFKSAYGDDFPSHLYEMVYSGEFEAETLITPPDYIFSKVKPHCIIQVLTAPSISRL